MQLEGSWARTISCSGFHQAALFIEILFNELKSTSFKTVSPPNIFEISSTRRTGNLFGSANLSTFCYRVRHDDHSMVFKINHIGDHFLEVHYKEFVS